MAKILLLRGADLAVLLLLGPLAGCSGGHRVHGEGHPFQVQVSPASLSIPAGGGGFVTVSTGSPLADLLDPRSPLTLSLQGAPAGVVASGSLAPGQGTGTLALVVDASVAPQSLSGVQVVASNGRWSGSTPFQLVITSPLPPGRIGVNGVQASGMGQSGGTLSNLPVIQEPVAATVAQDPAQVVSVRHGFLPALPAN